MWGLTFIWRRFKGPQSIKIISISTTCSWNIYFRFQGKIQTGVGICIPVYPWFGVIFAHKNPGSYPCLMHYWPAVWGNVQAHILVWDGPVDGFVLSALTQQWFALFSRHLLLNWDFKTKHPSSSAREEVLRPLVAIFIKPTHDLMLVQHKAISKCNTLTHPALSCNKTVLCYDLWFKKKYIWKKKILYISLHVF